MREDVIGCGIDYNERSAENDEDRSWKGRINQTES